MIVNVLARLEGCVDEYMMLGDMFVDSRSISVGDAMVLYVDDICVTGHVDMAKHFAYAISSVIYGGTFQLSDMDEARHMCICLTVLAEDIVAFKKLSERILVKTDV